MHYQTESGSFLHVATGVEADLIDFMRNLSLPILSKITIRHFYSHAHYQNSTLSYIRRPESKADLFDLKEYWPFYFHSHYQTLPYLTCGDRSRKQICLI